MQQALTFFYMLTQKAGYPSYGVAIILVTIAIKMVLYPLTVKQVKKLWNTEFKDEFKWPMKGTKMKTLPGVYRNRPNAYPLTLRPSNRQFNPNGLPMGIEEYRIIMGFPRNFKIYFDNSNKTYWLNKARNTLSKGSVYEVGIWFKKCIKNQN